MPFKSEKQKKWMYANKPEMAKKWTSKYGKGVKSASKLNNSPMRKGKTRYGSNGGKPKVSL